MLHFLEHNNSFIKLLSKSWLTESQESLFIIIDLLMQTQIEAINKSGAY